MTTPFALFVGCLAGGLAGFAAASAWFLPRLAARNEAATEAQTKLDQAASAQLHLAEMQAQLSLLRHDLNGILSPALLSADRLTSSEDPAVKRAGDVIIRTVERATARLAKTRG